MKASIYGIFRGARCLYVGATRNPKQRAYKHAAKFKRAKFRVLRQCAPPDMLRIEAQVIRAFRRLGHPVQNVFPVKRFGKDQCRRCGRPAEYYGPIGGYSVQCEPCNIKQRIQRNAGIERRRQQRACLGAL